MALSIPLSGRPYSEQSVSLDNILVSLVLKFNHVNNSWYLDILDSEGVVIKSGIKVVPNQNLTKRFNLVGLPNGDLWCIKENNNNSTLGRYNFGQDKDYGLYWISDKDMSELGVSSEIQF